MNRGAEIRTRDLLNPIQALYQAEPRPGRARLGKPHSPRFARDSITSFVGLALRPDDVKPQNIRLVYNCQPQQVLRKYIYTTDDTETTQSHRASFDERFLCFCGNSVVLWCE